MPKVLLVDADWENLVALQKALTAAGYEVSVALSGSFALTMLEWDRPDVIVSLTENQDMDGYELCSIIRADPATKDLPFLLLTGASGPIPGAAARVGVNRVIAGKFNVSTLVAQVGDLLGKKGAPASPPPSPVSPPASPTPHDRAERPIMN
jgi:CheY-like chemotaxis protein